MDPIDFNRDIRPILSGNCFKCHGPDENKREAELRLDTKKGAFADLGGGYYPIVPGKPDESEIVWRIFNEDEDDLMPPIDSGNTLTASEKDLIRRWIEEGGVYAGHWSYQKPVRPAVPEIDEEGFTLHNLIDHFVAKRLISENLKQAPEAGRYALARRVALDLTGLPPTLEEAEAFVSDPESQAFERYVQQLLGKPTIGEHWARTWLDLARYADSAGYANDNPRTIWGFRDYVIRSLNENKPFDQFTIEQIAGDLLENPTTDQLVATAFHRNTQTNNEGGTNDEEFRNVAIVDRVNTTMAVWMGTTINCAQCHSHKYDPISQEEFFRMYAILNNSSDEDRADEAPTIPIYPEAQKIEIAKIEATIAALENDLKKKLGSQNQLERRLKWEAELKTGGGWHTLQPTPDNMKADSGATFTTQADGTVLVGEDPAPRGTYWITAKAPAGVEKVTGIRLEVLPLESTGDAESGQEESFILNELELILIPPGSPPEVRGRYVKIELTGEDRALHLPEVEIFSGENNIAGKGIATQSSTANEAIAKLAIDGNTSGFAQAKSTSITEASNNPWWELNLVTNKPLTRIVVWNGTEGGFQNQLDGFKLSILDYRRDVLWENTFSKATERKVTVNLSSAQLIKLTNPSATYEQDKFPVSLALDGIMIAFSGWAVEGNLGVANEAVFELTEPVEIPEGAQLRFAFHHTYQNRKIKRFRISVTEEADPRPAIPHDLTATFAKSVDERTGLENEALLTFFAHFDPESKAERAVIAEVRGQLEVIEPLTTVPVMKMINADRVRKTHLQRRGNYLERGVEVSPGFPSVFHPLSDGAKPDRLGLAQWLVDPDNPLTARVIANRYWEVLFGIGIVATSEEFGSQGELPSHPQLLDWLAVELMESGWDVKHLLRLILTSATYRQSSRVTPELYDRDPDNRLLARGPRFRISAEMVRDQALAISGLLSKKMYGPPVKPLQPEMKLRSAFGGETDWTTSEGKDKHRRGIYTTWRRSNPYPSMLAFDAPNREFCTLRRDRTNTPLQALVTLNDPVYIEASQALGRRMAATDGDIGEKAAQGFRLCLIRNPSAKEVAALIELYHISKKRYVHDQDSAHTMATDPIGPLPEGTDAAEYAAWTVVGNALLNLDEMFLKR